MFNEGINGLDGWRLEHFVYYHLVTSISAQKKNKNVRCGMKVVKILLLLVCIELLVSRVLKFSKQISSEKAVNETTQKHLKESKGQRSYICLCERKYN